MNTNYAISFLASTAGAATPLILAATGELVVERAGVLNLGVEGMMLVGAVAGFGVTFSSGSALLGLAAAMLAGLLVSLIFGLLTLSLQTNQVATGLALTLFGVGLSAFLGRHYVGQSVAPLPHLALPGLSDLPFVGPLLFQFDGMIYFSMIMVVVVDLMLIHTRLGLIIRAI